MNTMLKTGTASTAAVLALLLGACGDQTTAEDGPNVKAGAGPAGATTAQRHTAEANPASPRRRCRMSPVAVERWIRLGEPLPCTVDNRKRSRHYGDDRRLPASHPLVS
jgi:hypothetical protein